MMEAAADISTLSSFSFINCVSKHFNNSSSHSLNVTKHPNRFGRTTWALDDVHLWSLLLGYDCLMSCSDWRPDGQNDPRLTRIQKVVGTPAGLFPPSGRCLDLETSGAVKAEGGICCQSFRGQIWVWGSSSLMICMFWEQSKRSLVLEETLRILCWILVASGSREVALCSTNHPADIEGKTVSPQEEMKSWSLEILVSLRAQLILMPAPQSMLTLFLPIRLIST